LGELHYGDARQGYPMPSDRRVSGAKRRAADRQTVWIWLRRSKAMSKFIPYFLLACTIWLVAAPAFAGEVSRKPVTDAEDAALAAQQTADADQLSSVAAGDGVVLALAVVGVVFLVLYLTGAID